MQNAVSRFNASVLSVIPVPPVIESFLDVHPQLDDDNFVAHTAAVIGDVTLGLGTSIWYGASLRGDVHFNRIGARSNIQDNATVHVSRGTHLWG